MRAHWRSLGLVFLLGSACAQVIGLSDYEKTDEEPGAGRTGSGGVESGAGAPSEEAGSAGEAVASGGTTGEGEAGAGPTGGTTSAQGGGDIGTAGSSEGGTTSGEAGAPGAGGTVSRGGAGGATTRGGTTGAGGATTRGGTTGAGGTAATGCSVPGNLLLDPDFECNDGSWQEYSDNYLVVTEGVAHGDSTYSAWLGSGINDDVIDTGAYFWQTLTIPANARQLTLSCWYLIATQESSTTVGDELWADLTEVDSLDPVLNFFELDNTQSTDDWTLISYSAPATTVAGLELDLTFYMAQNEDSPTRFFIDTCSLTVN